MAAANGTPEEPRRGESTGRTRRSELPRPAWNAHRSLSGAVLRLYPVELWRGGVGKARSLSCSERYSAKQPLKSMCIELNLHGNTICETDPSEASSSHDVVCEEALNHLDSAQSWWKCVLSWIHKQHTRYTRTG